MKNDNSFKWEILEAIDKAGGSLAWDSGRWVNRAREIGRSATLATSALTGLIADQWITTEKDGRFIRRLAITDKGAMHLDDRRNHSRPLRVTATPVALSSTKAFLMDVMRRNLNGRGFVTLTNHQLARHAGISEHDLLKYLWDLKSEGVIAFDQRGSGSALRLDNIRIRPSGLIAPPEPAPEPTSGTTEAPGPQPGAPASSEGELPREAVPSSSEAYDDFPLIRALAGRVKEIDALRDAANRLEQAGLLEEAVYLSDRMQLTPLELEIVRFLLMRETTIGHSATVDGAAGTGAGDGSPARDQ